MSSPDLNPKTIYGLAKPSPSLVPPAGIINIALAFRDGARKYGPYNWRKDNVSSSTYIDAAFRHLMQWFDGEENSADADVPHLAHAAACLCILMDAQAQGTLIDDRPTKGRASELIKAATQPISPGLAHGEVPDAEAEQQETLQT